MHTLTPDENNEVQIYGHKVKVNGNAKTVKIFGTEYKVKQTKAKEVKEEVVETPVEEDSMDTDVVES